MLESKDKIVITIDGPAGAGKSTVAKALARRLGFAYLDTGAMYRALTLKALRSGIVLEDEEQLVVLAKNTKIHLEGDGQTQLKVILDGDDVSEEIRSLDVTNHTFYAARAPKVRAIMVDWQREMGRCRNVVVEGRDCGTVIFPNANFKFYLDADFTERSQRRILELRDTGSGVDEQKLKGELQERDHKDLNRDIGPLKMADDSTLIDSTYMSVDEVLNKILEHIKIKSG